MDAIQNLLSSIRTGQERLARVSQAIAGGGVPTATHGRAAASDRVDLSQQALELLQAEHQIALGARTLGRIDEAQDALLDVLA